MRVNGRKDNMQKYQAIAKAQVKKKKKMDAMEAEDVADVKKGSYNRKEEAAEEKQKQS